MVRVTINIIFTSTVAVAVINTGQKNLPITRAGSEISKFFLIVKYFGLQCNLDYPDLIYLDPRLSGLAGDQYHACAEGMDNYLLWVWSQVEQ